jgi:Alkylmercury lyase
MLIDLVRAAVYRGVAASGVAPGVPELGALLSASPDDVTAAIRELAERHFLVLAPDGRAIERALPFASVPTAFEVRARDRAWSANCVWDALALPPLLGVAADIHTTCPDCRAPLVVHVDPVTGPDHPALVAHFLLPASRWYDDIRYT